MTCCVCGSSEVHYARKGYVVCNIEQHTLCGRVANSSTFQKFMASANGNDPIELMDMPFEILYEIFAHLQDEPEQLRQLAITNSRLHALLAPLFLGNVLNPVMTKDLTGVDNETIRTIVKGVYRVAVRDAISPVDTQSFTYNAFSRIEINVAGIKAVEHRHRLSALVHMTIVFMQDGHLGLMQYTFQKAVLLQLMITQHAYENVIRDIARGASFDPHRRTPWAHTWTHIHRWIIQSNWWTIIHTKGLPGTVKNLTFHALWAAVRDNAMDVIELLNTAGIAAHFDRSEWQTLFGGMAALGRDQIFTAMIKKAWRVSEFTRDIIEDSIRKAKGTGSRAYLQAVVDWAGQHPATRDLMEQAMAALSELG